MPSRLSRLLARYSHETCRVVREPTRVAGIVELYDRGPSATGHEALKRRVDHPVRADTAYRDGTSPHATAPDGVKRMSRLTACCAAAIVAAFCGLRSCAKSSRKIPGR